MNLLQTGFTTRHPRLPVRCRPCPAAPRRTVVTWAARSRKGQSPSQDRAAAEGSTTGGAKAARRTVAEGAAALGQQAEDPEEEEEEVLGSGVGEGEGDEGVRGSQLQLEDGEGEQYGEDPPGHKAGFVAIIGRPNAGKSTLLNALLGQQLSIVTQKAQTTRHKILGILTEPGYQAVFLDTPGIIEDKRNKLEERMMRWVQESVKEADCVLAVVDAAQRPQNDLAMLQPGPDWDGPPMAVVLNKVDLLTPEQSAALEAWFAANSTAQALLPISALQGTNTAAVVDWVVAQLPEGPSMYPKGYVAEAPERFFVSEIIRRHVFLQYQQEIPYACAVEVVDYKERRGAKDFVDAHIIVEHERQRGILLGAGGGAIKALATAARLEIEEFVGRPVFLQLSVKVQKKWRKDAALLERLGY